MHIMTVSISKLKSKVSLVTFGALPNIPLWRKLLSFFVSSQEFDDFFSVFWTEERYLVGRYKPVRKLPKISTRAAGYMASTDFRIRSTTCNRAVCSCTDGTM